MVRGVAAGGEVLAPGGKGVVVSSRKIGVSNQNHSAAAIEKSISRSSSSSKAARQWSK